MRKKHSKHIACFILTFLLISMNIQVFAATAVKVTKVTLSKTTHTISVENTAELVATIYPINATTQDVNWTTSNENIAKVDNKGTVTGVGAGTAIITVKTLDGNKSATCKVTVNVPVSSVSLNKGTYTLPKGGKYTLIAAIAPSNATNKEVTWSSLDSKIVKVSNGVITGVTEGEGTIIVTSVDGCIIDSCSITVSKAMVTSINLNKTNRAILVGDTDRLIAEVLPNDASNKDILWKSSNTKVAIVTDGVVTGIGVGTAKITATTVDGNKRTSCNITVNPIKVTSVGLDKTTDTLTVKDTAILTATIEPTNATNKAVKWKSSNDSIAKVDKLGKVTALKAGKATITVTTVDGSKTASCEVTSITSDNTDITSKFTDVNFRNYVYAVIGKGRRSQILYSDVKNITILYVSNENIKSLSGIEYFTALTELYCEQNQLTTLDVSNNTALTTLVCYENKLTTLDVSKNTALTTLVCYENKLKTLDVSNNIALAKLMCSENQLKTLDVSKNIALTDLECVFNQLTTLDVSKNIALDGLVCSDNKLTTLDVSKNIALDDLICSRNQLTTLDVSNNTELTRLMCHENKLKTLDVSNNIALINLVCFTNQLSTLDVSKNIALINLVCFTNQLSTLDVSKNIALAGLLCSENQLTTLDVSNNMALVELLCSENQLTTLDVSKNVSLNVLGCSKNQLTTLDLSKNTKLFILDCTYNQLITLYSINDTWDPSTYRPQYTDSSHTKTVKSLVITIKN